MCNACGFICCASDLLYGCGCEHCAIADCWPDDIDEFGDELEMHALYPTERE